MTDNSKKNVYTNYSNRYGSNSLKPEVESNFAEENPTEALSNNISKKQLDLLDIYPNLPLIVNTLEDTIVIIDPDTGIETPESSSRRNALLDKLTNVYNSNSKLLKSARQFYPDFFVGFEQKLGNIYKDIVSKIRKLCADVNDTHVVNNELDVDVRTLVDNTVFGIADPVLDNESESRKISSRYTGKYKSSLMMKDAIAKDTDTLEYIKLLPEIPKYIFEEIQRFKERSVNIKTPSENETDSKEKLFTYEEVLTYLNDIAEKALQSQETATSYSKYFLKEPEKVPEVRPEPDTRVRPIYFREDEIEEQK